MFEVHGGEQLERLSQALKRAGSLDLQRELSKAITAEMKPLREQVKNNAVATLPRRGGLNKRVANSQLRTVKLRGGVRLQARSSYSLKLLDRGIVAHPVFGNRSRWVTEKVRPGWWSNPTKAAAPDVQKKLQAAMDQVAAKLSRVTR